MSGSERETRPRSDSDIARELQRELDGEMNGGGGGGGGGEGGGENTPTVFDRILNNSSYSTPVQASTSTSTTTNMNINTNTASASASASTSIAIPSSPKPPVETAIYHYNGMLSGPAQTPTLVPFTLLICLSTL